MDIVNSMIHYSNDNQTTIHRTTKIRNEVSNYEKKMISPGKGNRIVMDRWEGPGMKGSSGEEEGRGG